MPYVGKEPVRGQNRELDDISGTFNGGNTAFTMQVGGVNTAAGSANQVFINLGGVMQNPGTDFTVASSTITFTTPPANGLSFWGLIQGDAVDIQEPADGSVTNAKVASGAAIALDKLASTPAVLTGSTNNTVCTVTGANAIAGESTLTYDGAGQLSITGNSAGDGLSITNDGNHYTMLSMDADRSSGSNALGIIQGKWNNNSVCSMYLRSGADTSNKDDGEIAFNTSAASSSEATRMIIKNNGNVEISDGDLVIGTAGHGIDFSANSHAGGMTSELLDHYEEGSWTPTFFIGGSQATYSVGGQQGRYTKIGRLIYCQFMIDLATKGSGGSSSAVSISGLPYTSTNDSGDRMNGLVTYIGAFTGLDTGGIVLYNTTNTTSVTLYDAESTYTRTVKGENVENSSHLRGYVWYHC